MKRINVNKILYAFYTPLVWLLLIIKKVNICGKSYWNGIPSIDKGRNSTITIGNGCRFASRHTSNRLGLFHPCMITTQENAVLKIGNNCGFSAVSLWCFKCITIGNNVRVGANVTIMDGDAHQDDPRAGKDSPIFIEDNVWIGACSIVMKGVTIGRNSVIGAGSVVTKDIPENVVAAGNPCKVVRFYDGNKIKDIENYFK